MIFSNYIRKCKGHIVISSSSHTVISGNTLKEYSATGTGNGIFLNNYCQRNLIEGNTCYDNNSWGVRESDSGAGALKNVLLGNVCYDNDSGQIYQGSGTSTINDHNITS